MGQFTTNSRGEGKLHALRKLLEGQAPGHQVFTQRSNRPITLGVRDEVVVILHRAHTSLPRPQICPASESRTVAAHGSRQRRSANRARHAPERRMRALEPDVATEPHPEHMPAHSSHHVSVIVSRPTPSTPDLFSRTRRRAIGRLLRTTACSHHARRISRSERGPYRSALGRREGRPARNASPCARQTRVRRSHGRCS
jgi:hypothetical protein